MSLVLLEQLFGNDEFVVDDSGDSALSSDPAKENVSGSSLTELQSFCKTPLQNFKNLQPRATPDQVAPEWTASALSPAIFDISFFKSKMLSRCEQPKRSGRCKRLMTSTAKSGAKVVSESVTQCESFEH